jgi:hypothetical protein
MRVERVWMGLPSHPDYYRDFPKATLQKKVREGLAVFARDIKRNGMHPAFRSLLENNLANKDRIDYLRKLGKRLVSTKRQVYGTKNPVPDDALLNESRSRCRKLVTTDGATGTSVELSL